MVFSYAGQGGNGRSSKIGSRHHALPLSDTPYLYHYPLQTNLSLRTGETPCTYVPVQCQSWVSNNFLISHPESLMPKCACCKFHKYSYSCTLVARPSNWMLFFLLIPLRDHIASNDWPFQAWWLPGGEIWWIDLSSWENPSSPSFISLVLTITWVTPTSPI